MTGIVDAHVHLWDVDRMHLPWFRPELGLPRVASLDDLRAASAGRIDGAIAVQAADTLGEARWLADLAARDRFVRGLVLQYDPRADATAWAGMAQAMIDGPNARIGGIRLATPGGAADFGDVPGLDALADGLARTGRVLELLIRPAQLPAAAALARRHPSLAVVACHLAIGGEPAGRAWLDGLGEFAAQPNTAAKVSGLVRHAAGDDERVARLVRTAVAAFGADRLMFGSDWPISARFVPYAEVVRSTEAALPPLDAAARRAFWRGTAMRLYALAPVG